MNPSRPESGALSLAALTGTSQVTAGQRETKLFPFELTELKELTDAPGWEVAGYASTFGGEPDSYGDVVERGAFVESLKRRLPKFLYQHYEPIGITLEMYEDRKGLFGRARIIDTTTGTDAYKLAKAGALDAFSIGYVTIKAKFRDDDVRVIQEVDLPEWSIVAIPANTNAVLTSVKSDVPFERFLSQVVLSLRAGIDEAEALYNRRASESRKLTEAHVAAIDALLAEAKAGTGRLTALLEVPEAEAAVQPMTPSGLKLDAFIRRDDHVQRLARYAELGIHI